MAPATTPDSAEPSVRPTAGDDDPIPVEEIVRRGVTAGGKRLLELTVDLATGRLSFVYDTAARAPSAVAPPPLPQMSDLAKEILQVLDEAAPGEWLKGPEIAARISDDVDAAGGGFQRAIAELRKGDLVESQTRHGYRRKKFD